MSLFSPSTWFLKKNAIDPWVEEFVQQMEDAGLPVKIAEVRRTAARQKELYAQGRTQPGAIVTWTTKSQHIVGRAFDFDFVEGAANTDESAFAFAGEIGAGLGLLWGGDWDVQDLRHFELPDDEG